MVQCDLSGPTVGHEGSPDVPHHAFLAAVLPAPMGAVFVFAIPWRSPAPSRLVTRFPFSWAWLCGTAISAPASSGLAGLRSLVVTYDSMLGDPVKSSREVGTFLEYMGVQLEPGTSDDTAKRLDPRLRHQVQGPDEYHELVQAQREVLSLLTERAGQRPVWEAPPSRRRQPGSTAYCAFVMTTRAKQKSFTG